MFTGGADADTWKSPLVDGFEGEVKILSRILEQSQLEAGGEPESHMVLGCDSDLLLMALVSGGLV